VTENFLKDGLKDQIGSAIREQINTMGLGKVRLLGWQIDGTGSEWCPMAALVLAVLQLLVSLAKKVCIIIFQTDIVSL
jgi:hypothetical protein